MSTDDEPRQPANQAQWFATTHWTVVLVAGQWDSEAQIKALSKLCQTYWYPVYAFVRRAGRNSHDAQDMAQGFFAHLLEKKSLRGLDRGKGKFRSFLLVSLKNFLKDEVKWFSAEKRGGKADILSFHDAENRYVREPSHELTPEKIYERTWVITLLEKVMGILSEEQARAGKSHIFEKLKHWVGKNSSDTSYRELATQLSMSEESVRKAVQRLRKRYGFLLRAEIANTVTQPEEIEEEIRALFAAWN